MTKPNPGKSAWDYGLPQQAVEVATASLTEAIGCCTDLANGTHLIIPNIAAGIIHDLLTSGAMSPAIPDVPPPAREKLMARVFTAKYGGRCPRCGDPIEPGVDEITYHDDDIVHADYIDRPEKPYRGWMEGDGDE
ncbi:MAG: hypothetical protein ACRDQA_07520 [Nocardioidaceae bacterium]